MSNYQQQRSTYAEYMAEGVRYALHECKMSKIPSETYWVVQPWSFLSQLDFVLGFSVLIADMPMAQEFVIATPASEPLKKFKKAFNEYLSLYEIKEQP